MVDNLDDLKDIKYSDEEVFKAYLEGEYTSITTFYNDIKNKIDYSRQTLRNKLIEKKLYVSKGKKKTEEELEPTIPARKYCEVIFNDFLAKEHKIKDIPKGRKKWFLPDEELDQLGEALEPYNKAQLPTRLQNGITLVVALVSIIFPRVIASLKELKEAKEEKEIEKT